MGERYIMTIYSAALMLILVMDPFGNIPVFISVLSSVDPVKRSRIILREMLIALGILILFLFFGKYILSGIHISEPALSISGGTILFLIALKMIFPPAIQPRGESYGDDPVIVPLAMPMVAGPSAMTMVILLSTGNPDRIWMIFASLIIAWSLTALILITAEKTSALLGKKFIIAIERLMGMILTTMAIQMLLTGIEVFIKNAA